MQIQLSTAAVHFGTALKYRRGWAKNNIGVEILSEFNKGKGKKASQRYRLYLPIHAVRQKVKIPPSVQRAVEAAGYTISDYVGGFATQKDGKRVMKIGKLIKDEHVRNMFANDEQRQSHKNEYTCVISCHPYDIIGMSTGRTWDQFSCMRLGAGAKLNPDSNNGDDGAYADSLSHDIKQGTLVAYAIKNADVNISKPDARLLIKPYMNERQDQVLFRVETKVYGNHVTGFRETINAWLRKVNANATSGRYSLMKGLYNDGAGYHARHMGPVAYADLSDPKQLEEWLAHAEVSDYSEKFKEGKQEEITAILKNSEGLYFDYVFNDAVQDLFHPDEVDLDDAKERMGIIVPKLIEKGRDGNEMLSRLMNHVFAKYTIHAIPQDVMDQIRELVRYNPDRNYPHSFLTWAYKFNPTVIMQPNGDVSQDFDRYIRPSDYYPFCEPTMLKANKTTKLYKLALIESFKRFAASKMKGLKSTMGWEPIDPSMVPNDDFIRNDLNYAIGDMKWTDAQKLYAFTANSFDWLNEDNAHLINLFYLENLKIADLFNTPYIATIYNTGVADTENDKAIAANFATLVERTCRVDKEGVKAEETRMFELAELLGEHDYNVKRGIEREVERALYD